MATDETGDTVPQDQSAEREAATEGRVTPTVAGSTGSPGAGNAGSTGAGSTAAGNAGSTAAGDADGPHTGGSSLASRVGSGARELVVVVVMALALSFVVKTWLVQAFYIPSASMEDTLLVNDRVVVNKLTPGLMHLQRGDVVVFSDPDHWLAPTPQVDDGPVVNGVRSALIFVGLLPNPSDDHLIKRVIGMPGDHVVCCDASGKLTVNGTPITEPYIKPGVTPSDRRFDITVPRDKIWVMGDNRSNSEDSRFHDASGDGADGSVPISAVTGRAIAIVWPFDRITWLSDHPDTWADVPNPSPAPTHTVTTTSSAP